MTPRNTVAIVGLVWLIGPVTVGAQSSSLWIDPPQPYQIEPEPGYIIPDYALRQAPPHQLSASLTAVSLVAVPPPKPRRFSQDDLITVIIRESTEADWESSLETGKEVEFKGAVKDLPDIWELFHFNLVPDMDIQEEEVKLDIEWEQDFEGDGDMTRRETITGRIQARVIDVRPNGTLVLEARKYNQVDNETLTLILTGTCRADDVAVDNTILSTQLYDLHLVKTHEGELRRSSQKGVITRVIEFFFNF